MLNKDPAATMMIYKSDPASQRYSIKHKAYR